MQMLTFQIIYTAIIFAVLSVLKHSSITVWEGFKGAFMVLSMTAYFILIIKVISSFCNDLPQKNQSRNIKSLRSVFNAMSYVMFGLFIISLCIAVLSFIGVLVSNVSVTTSYILLLVVPMWLSVRKSINNFLKQLKVE